MRASSTAEPHARRRLRAALVPALALLAAVTGCRSTYPVRGADPGRLESESTVIVVRPDRHTPLGTRSVRDYLEIVGESTSLTSTGHLVVRVGLRNRGGTRWYDPEGPTVRLSIQTRFFAEPIGPGSPPGMPVHETNWEVVTIPRGDTHEHVVTCPLPGPRGYQVVISEQLAP